MWMTILGTPLVLRNYCYFNPKSQVSFNFGWSLDMPGMLHYHSESEGGWCCVTVLREIHSEHTGRFVAIEWTEKQWAWARSLK